ncbi:MAG TPA: D-2-hydroxyacid dehydrogenase family protein [Nakamurella sp.]
MTHTDGNPPAMRCAVLDDYQDAALTVADWSPITEMIRVDVFRDHLGTEDELVTALAPYDIVVLMRERTALRAAVLNRLPRLKLIVTTGMRNASIDMSAAAAHGVMVCGTASSSDPPAELTWTLILGLARHLTTENAGLRAGDRWQRSIGKDLAGSRLGVLGLGRIGSRVARIGLAFGMQVTAWSENLTRERTDRAGVEFAASKEELLESSDFVSIHLVLGDRTKGLIGADELARMRSTAYLINTSRAAIVDEAALVQALRTGRIAGAGLDVFDLEPLPGAHILRSLPNVLATPHLGYVTTGNYRTYYREAIEDIAGFLAGLPRRQLA